ncbi:MAG TPA: hypothetical protein VGC92_04010 [Phenylobacterium sp.]|jgi:hypothetical protein
MVFARRIFTLAAIYGVIVLAPIPFLEALMARTTGPVTYPEYYYGFALTALVFQGVFFVIGRDPVRYRALMPVGVLEKLSFGVPCWVLYAQHRLGNPQVLPFATIDLALGVLFAISWFKTAKS